MTLTVDNFRIDYPQFDNESVYPPSVVERFLDRAAARMDQSVWGALFDEGQGALAAHLLVMAYGAAETGGLATGAITAIAIPNEISVSYASPSVSAAANEYSTTKYGQAFLSLSRQALGIAARFIST